MRQKVQRLWVLGLAALALAPALGQSKDKKAVEMAPLPSIISNAKKIFISNGGGSNLAFDAFYSAIKQWGRYEIVGAPDAADLIVELACRVDQGGTHVWSTTNTYNHTTQVHSAQIVDPQVVLAIYDGKTRTQLWSETDHRKLARRQKNRDKETVNSAQRLVEDLKARVDVQQ